MNKAIILLFAFSIILGSCKKDDENEPIVTEPKEDILNPSLLQKKALIDFTESELHCNIASSFTVKNYYRPLKEYSTLEVEDGFLRYQLSYSLICDGDSIELERKTISSSEFTLDSKKPLEFNKSYTLTVIAKWQKKHGVNGDWEDCPEKYWEKISQTIITSKKLVNLSINQSDIEFQYPLDRQFNYLKEEYQKGYFRLNNSKKKELLHFGGIIQIKNVKDSSNINTIRDTLEYNEELNIFEYHLQANPLRNEAVYEISLLTKNNDLAYQYYFKTSKYNTFTEKWSMLKKCFKEKYITEASGKESPYTNIIGRPLLRTISVEINEETLDYYENNTNNYSSSLMPLIQFETHVPDTWKTTAEWKIYSMTSLDYNRKSTKSKKYGFPPLRAIYFQFNEMYAVRLSDESINGNIEYPNMPSYGGLTWEVITFMYYDTNSAYRKAYLKHVEKRNKYEEIAATNFEGMNRLDLNVSIHEDTFPLVNVYYVLPGIDIETTKITDFQL